MTSSQTGLPVPGSQSCRVGPPALVSWHCDTADRWRVWTLLTCGGLIIGVALAIFGLPPVDLHPPTHFAGIMDPFCGGTRAIRLAVLGRWGESWAYNPLGLLVLLAFAALAARAVVGVSTHRWYTISIGWTRKRAWIAVSIVVVLLVGLEIRQQSIAPLLMAR